MRCSSLFHGNEALSHRFGFGRQPEYLPPKKAMAAMTAISAAPGSHNWCM
jgi:hypothetical protein